MHLRSWSPASVRPSVGGNQMISLFARTRAYVDVSLSGVGKRLSWTRIGASASEGREEGVEKKGKRGRERWRGGRNADDGRGRGRAERASKNVVDLRANRYDYRPTAPRLSVRLSVVRARNTVYDQIFDVHLRLPLLIAIYLLSIILRSCLRNRLEGESRNTK